MFINKSQKINFIGYLKEPFLFFKMFFAEKEENKFPEEIKWLC